MNIDIEAIIARCFISRIPDQIADRIIDKNLELAKLIDYPRIYLGELGAFSFVKIVEAIEAFKTNEKVEVCNDKGVNYVLIRHDNGGFILLQEDHEYLIPELGLLDLDPLYRVATFKLLIGAVFIQSKFTSKWYALLEKKQPNGKEFFCLLGDIQANPWEQERLLRSKANLKLSDMFPDEEKYYQALLPISLDDNNEKWVSDILIPELKQQLDENLEAALWDICTVGFDGYLNLSQFIENIDNDKLFGALTRLSKCRSLFVRAGILEMALHKQKEDDRYSLFIRELIEKIDSDQASGLTSEQLDLFELYIEKAEQRINVLEKAFNYSLSWRRLSAFIHASHLIEAIGTPENDEEFMIFIKQPLGGNLSFQVYDRIRSPLPASAQYTADKLQIILQGRTLSLLESEKNTLNEVDDDKVETRKKIKSSFELIRRFSPLINCPSRLIEITSTEFVNATALSLLFDQLEKNCFDECLKQIAGFGTIHIFNSEWVDLLIKSVASMRYQSTLHEEGEIPFFNALERMSGIASVQPSECLANAVATKLYTEAPKFIDLNHVQLGCILLTLSAGAFVDTEERRKWLGNKMAQYAFYLPHGAPSKQLITTLQILECAFPLTERCFGQAKKYAASAIK